MGFRKKNGVKIIGLLAVGCWLLVHLPKVRGLHVKRSRSFSPLALSFFFLHFPWRLAFDIDLLDVATHLLKAHGEFRLR